MFAFDDVLDWRWRSAESLKPECKVIFSYNITVHSTVHNTVQYSTWCGELSSLESVWFPWSRDGDCEDELLFKFKIIFLRTKICKLQQSKYFTYREGDCCRMWCRPDTALWLSSSVSAV